MNSKHTFGIAFYLQQTSLFGHLDEASVARIAHHSQELHCRQGTVVFHEGQAFSGLFMLIEGQLKRYFRASDGSERICDMLKPGECCGEAALFSGKPYSVSAVALCDSIVLKISAECLFAELLKSPELVNRMMGILAERTHQMLQTVESISQLSGLQRTVQYLLQLVEENCPNSAKASLTLPTAKGDLASRLNLSAEHLSRLLMELQTSGLVAVHGRKIDIPNIEQLRQLLKTGTLA